MGLGEAFARNWPRGAHLVLVARSEDKPNVVTQDLQAHAGVEIIVIAADLSSAEGVERLITDVKRRDLRIDFLINNAGLGVFENLLDTPPAKQLEQVDLNVRAVVCLTHAFLPGMVAAHCGGVINLASTAALQPLAGVTVYAASKAFVLFLSEGLALELEGTGVKVMAACPGPIATDSFVNMSPTIKAEQINQPGPVARDILRGFEKGKAWSNPAR